MDTVTANLVLFFFLLTMRRSSLYLPIASLVNVQKMIKKRNGFWKGKYVALTRKYAIVALVSLNTCFSKTHFSGRCEAFSNQKTSINLNECVVFYRIIQNKAQKEAKKDIFCFVNNTLKKFFFLFFSEESDSKISFQFWTRFVKKVKGASDIVENVVEL